MVAAMAEANSFLNRRRRGAIQTMPFLGVNDGGLDSYNVRQDRGSTQWVIGLDENGLIATAPVTPGR